MQTDRFVIETKVLPKALWHGAQADHLAAMIASDSVIRARVLELAEKAKQGRKPTSQAGQEGPRNFAHVG